MAAPSFPAVAPISRLPRCSHPRKSTHPHSERKINNRPPQDELQAVPINAIVAELRQAENAALSAVEQLNFFVAHWGVVGDPSPLNQGMFRLLRAMAALHPPPVEEAENAPPPAGMEQQQGSALVASFAVVGAVIAFIAAPFFKSAFQAHRRCEGDK